MKKSTMVIGGIVLLAVILFFAYRNNYNKAIEYKTNVDRAWADVQVTYQRRADLVPQLVKVVKAAAANEKDILTTVTNARAGIGNASDIKTPAEMEKYGAKVNTAINVVMEAYPQIRSTQNFSDLQAQLEGTENRISTARTNYNEAVFSYNTFIQGFFNSMLLNKQTFPLKDSFAADAGASKAPDIDL